MWDETAGDIEVIWVRREPKYFSNQGWTTESRIGHLICPTGSLRARHLALVSNLSPSAIRDYRLHRRRDAHYCHERQPRTRTRRSDRRVRSPCRSVASATLKV